jgi:hypothetical protein
MMMETEPSPPPAGGSDWDYENAVAKMVEIAISKDEDDVGSAEGPPIEEKKDGEMLEGEAVGSFGNRELQQQKQAEGEAELIASAMTLEVAYQSLEMVRKLNLQVEFGKDVVDDSLCVTCLRTEPKLADAPPATSTSASRFGKWMTSSSASISDTLSQRKVTAAAGIACFTCGSPVCKRHRSSDFGKQNIIVCSDCAHLFSTNYMIHHVVDVDHHHDNSKIGDDEQVSIADDELDAKKRVNNMLDVYDRSLLVLRYSIQYIDEVATALRTNTSRHNRIGLGSSATGVVAGGLGVAAACTIWTPVGPPLLLASILFGGGATAVNAGSEAVNYRCEPNKMADRILTLHSIVSSIAQLPGVMDHRLMMREERERQLQQREEEDGNAEGAGQPSDQRTIALRNQIQDEDQSRLHWTRTAMNGLKPLTMGALSAVSIVTEAREMKRAVDKIRAGNPCDKAERLLTVKDDIKHIPNTEDLAHQLHLILSRQKEH